VALARPAPVPCTHELKIKSAITDKISVIVFLNWFNFFITFSFTDVFKQVLSFILILDRDP
jgi:hypothetical protein